MSRNIVRVLMGLFAAVLFGMAGCGGSSGTSTATVSGTASGGALITGKTVKLKDANGKSAVDGTTDATTGKYSIDVTGLTPPFLIMIPGTNYVSLAQAAGTANINPITTAVVVLAAGNPNISDLFTNGSSKTVAANYDTATTNFAGNLQSSPVQSSVTNVKDYFTGTITAGTGIDAVFDKYSFTINPNDRTNTITIATIGAPVPLSYSISTTMVTQNGQLPVFGSYSSHKFLHYTLPDQYNFLANNPGKTVADEAAALFSKYTLTTGIDYGGGTTVSGYSLDQFVDKTAVNAATPDPDGVLGTNDARQLYSAVIRSNKDGFSNRSKFVANGLYNSDLRWDQFSKGYLLDINYTGKTYFTATLTGEFMKMFNTQYAYDLYLFRRIDVKRPDAAGSLTTFEVAATTNNYVADTTYTTTSTLSTTKFTVGTKSFGTFTNVRAISLDQFITSYVTDTPAAYTYKIVGLDGTYKDGWTYANMQQAYYLPDFDFVCQVSGGSQVTDTKINFPVRIEVVGTGTPVVYDYSKKNPPAFAKAYVE